MENRIHALDSQLSNQIAAGEVVERPAAALKELLENSLDADATEIRISITGGGIDQLEVSDNGRGIHPDDLPLALSRHATSKINKVDDLFAIHTWGFRGEALASLAAISRLRLQSRRTNESSASEILAEGGEILRKTFSSRPVGTTVVAENLFYNTPARKKFLKTIAAETNACIQIVQRLALASPQIQWELNVNGDKILSLPATNNPKERIAQVFWEAFHTKISPEDLIPFSKEKPNGSVSGWILPTSYFIPTSRGIFTFVNKRFVKDKLMQQAILAACKEVLFGHQYPQMILQLNLPPEEVDVNVHPTKAEVRFRNPNQIFGLIRSTVEEALAATRPISDTSRTISPQPEIVQENFSLLSSLPTHFQQKESFSPTLLEEKNISTIEINKPQNINIATSSTSCSTIQFLGTIKNTYIVCQDHNGLLLIDQHAAHERITYERLKKSQLRDLQVSPLLIPIGIELPTPLADSLEPHFEKFEKLGMQMDRIGPSLISVRSLPSLLLDKNNSPRVQLHLLIKEVAAQASEVLAPEELLLDKILHVLATQSCHSSVRAGQSLSELESRSLISQMNETDYSGHCPHGRPTTVRLNWEQLERLFKRIQ